VNVLTMDSEAKVAILDGDRALSMWPTLQDHFERSLQFAHDDMTYKNILAGVLDGTLLLLVVHRDGEVVGSAALEVAELRDHRVLHCLHFAGRDLLDWGDTFVLNWEKVAHVVKCDRISIKGREGWAREARRYGFKHSYTVMHKDIGVST
jgi:hypothetical protein